MENQRLNFKLKERLIDRIFATSRLLLKVKKKKKNQCLTHFGNIIISSSYIHRKNGKSHIGQISLSTFFFFPEGFSQYNHELNDTEYF